MAIRQVTLGELDESVRSFLAGVGDQEGLLIKDDSGHLRYGIIPYHVASSPERERAWGEIERLQKKVGRALEDQGFTEDDLDRMIQDD